MQVLLSDEGWTSPQIAHDLFLGEGAIRLYLEAEEEGSLSLRLESEICVKSKEIQAYVVKTFQECYPFQHFTCG